MGVKSREISINNPPGLGAKAPQPSQIKFLSNHRRVIMTKKMKQFLLFGALFVLGTALFAQTEADFEAVLTEDGNGAVIKKYTGKVTKTITIPATIKGLPVREIGEAAFIGAGTVSDSMGMMKADVPFTVVLPQGLVKIGDNAFAESALTSVVIPDSVTEIGELAFANYELYTRTGRLKPANPSLTSVTLPKGLAKVGRGAFKGNSALKTVVIPDGCSVLGEEMFAECTALATITIPKSIISIPSNAFARCTGLKTLVLPEGLTEICGGNSGTGAFFACTALTSVTLPSTITAIGNTAFRGCSALTTVTIPDSVGRIDGGNDFYVEKTLLEWAFLECGKLNLASQARLRKIAVVSLEKERQEQARIKQQDTERQRQEQARITEQQRQEQARIMEQQRHEQGIYYVGDTGPTGCIVFYDKGSKSNGWQYLEAAPDSSEFIAYGYEAAEKCEELNINGIGGWRLPTIDELNHVYENLYKKGLGGFRGDRVGYWSSSKNGHDDLLYQEFDYGSRDARYNGNGIGRYVRAVRTF
jgi:hypothetical protein